MSQITNWRSTNIVSQRPLLERVDEVDDDTSSRYSTNDTGCMKYFGIKSYLNNFYDRTAHSSEPDGSQFKYLTRSRQKKFSSNWWKATLYLGTTLVFLGFTILLVGLLLPRKNIEISSDASSITVDRNAMNFNQNLEYCRLFGIFIFVAGGFLFTVSLFLPTFCNTYCAAETDEVNYYTDPFKVR
ncbi:unnamed protein product [Didymodactylos carnosus]|uniref:Uncharacterized protein n=1 Tax=Didymodactylos carnosus TaxID=1234261 RepID=A0A8S2G268_9BILA|nr:unnamed protein product [Didymodactylos carnosus]CAF4416292.1 unnamed protein product [Didymodactylos carnosus]